MQEFALADFMKRLPAFLLMIVLGVGCFAPAYIQAGTSAQSQARAARKAQKKQQKAQKKYAKAQRKSEKKMLRTERKNSKRYPAHY